MPDQIEATLRQASQQLAAIVDSARLEAEILLSHLLDKDRVFLRAWPERKLTAAQIQLYKTLIYRRLQGEPIAYITGQREFWSRAFHVSPDVLIPRPDTELLIELALTLIPDDRNMKIIDLGTGSGIIAITLAVERPRTQVLATDQSEKALTIAKHNAIKHQASNVQFRQSNWLEKIESFKADLIVSNPPYIDGDDPHLRQGDLRFEPKSSLVSQDNGLADIQLIAEQAPQFLNPGGYLLLEHGFNQEIQVQTILNRANFKNIKTFLDLSGHPRVTQGLWI